MALGRCEHVTRPSAPRDRLLRDSVVWTGDGSCAAKTTPLSRRHPCNMQILSIGTLSVGSNVQQRKPNFSPAVSKIQARRAENLQTIPFNTRFLLKVLYLIFLDLFYFQIKTNSQDGASKRPGRGGGGTPSKVQCTLHNPNHLFWSVSFWTRFFYPDNLTSSFVKFLLHYEANKGH